MTKNNHSAAANAVYAYLEERIATVGSAREVVVIWTDIKAASSAKQTSPTDGLTRGSPPLFVVLIDSEMRFLSKPGCARLTVADFVRNLLAR